MIFKSCHCTSDSDIFVSSEGYELIRSVLGFGIERVSIIYQGVKVHQIEAQDGLQKAMDWCRDYRLTLPVPELDFANYAEQQR
jgi:hypothetical protein